MTSPSLIWFGFSIRRRRYLLVLGFRCQFRNRGVSFQGLVGHRCRGLLEFAIGLQLLLHGFSHADGVYDQFEMPEDLGFVADDVTLDGIVAEQFGQVAFGDHQVE